MSEPENEPVDEREQRVVRVRRAPRYFPFALTGFALGAVLGLVVAQLPPEQVDTIGKQLNTRSPEMTFVLLFGLIGVLLALGLALLLERRRH
ncbi:hypothetical protein ACIB24_01540 [Spongisporangium articulatum]|uniref:Uncharacterized protein n=1 Tax=Spongisporangium articulatum TaxID=3362603 RepID=A0ABW8AHV0_9ACTN